MGGFTLIEVMVALAIVALALGAVAASVSQMVEAATSMRDRTLAAWIGQNKVAELRLANVVPDVSETSGSLTYAGREWTWRSTISETGVEFLYRVDVEVSLGESEEPVRTITGFVGEPSAPGQSNLSWSSASFAVGEEQ